MAGGVRAGQIGEGQPDRAGPSVQTEIERSRERLSGCECRWLRGAERGVCRRFLRGRPRGWPAVIGPCALPDPHREVASGRSADGPTRGAMCPRPGDSGG